MTLTNAHLSQGVVQLGSSSVARSRGSFLFGDTRKLYFQRLRGVLYRYTKTPNYSLGKMRPRKRVDVAKALVTDSRGCFFMFVMYLLLRYLSQISETLDTENNQW